MNHACRRIRHHALILGVVLFLAVTGPSCTTGLGPKAIRTERPDYNQQIAHSGDEQMLLNLVRLRYNDSPVFLELGSIIASYGYDAGLSAGGTIAPNAGGSSSTPGAALGYYEHPTVTYSPLSGDQFATRMLTPIPLDSLMLFAQSGWSTERLFLVTVQRINDVYNPPSSSGPTPLKAPDYAPFSKLARQLQDLAQAGLTGSNWDRHGHETNAPGRNPVFWIHPPADPNSQLAEEVQAVRQQLGLQPGRNEFALSAFPYRRQPNEVAVRCRSLLGILYFLSTAVVTPPPHLASGLVTVTKDEDGQPFDWAQFTGKVMSIHSAKERPIKAAVAVQHRDWWFYVADDDQNSKITFNLLNILFQLQAATASGRSPLLTVQTGG
ncbi:MAG: hypothetical protein RIS76_52 [Verrucomicrobiota bacterium]|jgi:hypothetical protein